MDKRKTNKINRYEEELLAKDIYPFSCIKKEIDGTSVELIGVGHTKKLYDKWRDFYEEKIGENDFIFLEKPGNAKFFQDKDFFWPLGEFALKNGKGVCIADPVNEATLKFQERLDRIPILNIYSDLEGLIDLFSHITKKDINLNKIRKYLYNLNDWRNLEIAQGIRTIITDKFPEGIVSFQGDFHNEGISFYLDNPEIIMKKHKMYKNFNKRSVSEIKIYNAEKI